MKYFLGFTINISMSGFRFDKINVAKPTGKALKDFTLEIYWDYCIMRAIVLSPV